MDANICIWSFEFKLIHYDNADAYLNGGGRSKPPEGKEQDGSYRSKSKPSEGKEQDSSYRSKPPEKVEGAYAYGILSSNYISVDNAYAYLNGGGKSKPPEGKEQDGSYRSKPPERTERDGREEN
ncbi:hypothetical protein NC653_018440 [Populus alba x Populus x berolinensis]|uniref:Uncharacterized protein n=1 Tax=Populus alba x Populus x berolinensis TaxID=444605 RepID=A0AAD6QGG0_9ROSI|nr:hypothetical protein NC653_018440 [Populus alba x Populus x berolinensis]